MFNETIDFKTKTLSKTHVFKEYSKRSCRNIINLQCRAGCKCIYTKLGPNKHGVCVVTIAHVFAF